MTCHSYAHLHKNINIIHKPHLNIRSTDGRSFRSVEQSQINTEWPLYRQPEIPRQFAALLRGTRHACYSHIMPILVLNTCMDANMQLTIHSFRQLFHNISPNFSKIPDISLTAVKFPDISRFSRQVVTLNSRSKIGAVRNENW